MNNPDMGAGDAVLQASMLGGLRLTMGERTLTQDENRAQKLWSVLCYLILHRARSVPQSELIDLFWPEENRANPTSALKTLLHRTRAMLEPLFPDGPSPILSGRGSYTWNSALPCRVDAEEFDRLCGEAENEQLSKEARLDACRRAEALYQGDLLPKLRTQLWVVTLETHYHTRYVELIKGYAALLEEEGDFPRMERVCSKACRLDPLDEELQVLLIRALLRQGKSAAALSQYEAATDLLYRNLGVHPSQALRALYREIMDVEKGLEVDLEVIQRQLQEAAGQTGAFVCEYGFFQQVYRLEARRAARNGSCIHIALLTVSQPGGGVPPLNVLNQTMDQLLEVIAGRLRRGDVVSRFSGAQYVLMLPGATQVVSPMNKKIPLAAAVLLCLACLVLGGGLAFLWLGGGTPPQAPQLPVSTPAQNTPAPTPSLEPAATPSPTPEEVPEGNPAMDDNGLPKDGVYVTDARAAYVSGSMRLIIPKLGVDIPVLDGTDATTLLQGVGLYDYAQLPSEGGANVSIAGHRNGLRGGVITDNMPFYYINTLTEGDYLYLTEGDTIYQYQWECTQVIEPDDWSVVYNRGYGCVTLTTCTPIGVADHRLVVRGELVATHPMDQDYPFPSDTGKE